MSNKIGLKKQFYFWISVTFILIGTLTQAITIKSSDNLEFKEVRLFNFKYKFKNDILDVSEKSSDYNEALKVAAQKCFYYYSKRTDLNEQIGLEIIDICANPKS